MGAAHVESAAQVESAPQLERSPQVEGVAHCGAPSAVASKWHGTVMALQLLAASACVQFDLRERSPRTALFTCRRLHTVCREASPPVGLNSIAVNAVRPHLFAVGGSDECARVYDARR